MNRFSEAIESGERNDGFERGFEKYLGQSRELDSRKLRATAFYLLTPALMGDPFRTPSGSSSSAQKLHFHCPGSVGEIRSLRDHCKPAIPFLP
jgi:hypothetical protein